MSYSITQPAGTLSYGRVRRGNRYPGFRGYGADLQAAAPFLPANPFAVPLLSGDAQMRAATFAAPADCGPGMTREPILGQCLPTGTDPTRCPPGMQYQPGKGCLFIPQAGGCPPGTQSDPAGISCWPTGIPGAQPTQPTQGGGCPSGYVKDPVLGTSCIPTSWQVPGSVPGQGIPSAPGCFLGQVKDAAGNCVFPICIPGQTFNVSTGGCEATGGGDSGYDIVRTACDLIPAGFRPPGCPPPAQGSTGTTPAASLAMLCGLVPKGWPAPPGCGVLPDGTVVAKDDVTGGGVSVTVPGDIDSGMGVGAALLALGAVGVAMGGIYYYQKRKKGKR